MLKVLKWFVIVVAVLIVSFIALGFLLPSSYSVERSVVINAPPEQVHRLVGDLQEWPQWTPWLEMDPSIQTTFGPVTAGVGASQSWTGDSGGGELTVTRWDPRTGVEYEMSFDGKYPSVGAIRYETTPVGTKVTWNMRGEMGGFIGGYMGLMMESLVGPSFEAGLAKLKTEAEALPPAEVVEEEPEAAEAAG